VTTRFQELCKSLEDARSQFAGYRSECVLFAATLSRGLMEYSGWPRELVGYEPLSGEDVGSQTDRIEDAMHLDSDAYWHFGLRLGLEEPRGRDSVLLRVRFKKLDTRYIVSLFGFEDFEVSAPTPEQLQPIHESILNAMKRHYEYGLRLFVENGGRGLKIEVSAPRLLEMSRGVAAEPSEPEAPPASERARTGAARSEAPARRKRTAGQRRA
jgi:hypothetical protein